MNNINAFFSVRFFLSLFFSSLSFSALLIFPPAAAAEDLLLTAEGFRHVTGPADLQFPRDHGAHPEYQTEWWYFTGHIHAESGDTFGFELTFFRIGVAPPSTSDINAVKSETGSIVKSAWKTSSIYLAHVALTDDRGTYLPAKDGGSSTAGRFYSAEYRSRGAFDEAGSSPDHLDVHLKDLQAEQTGETVTLSAANNDLSFHFPLQTGKVPVLHGDRGYSRKGSEPGQASQYFSFTRLTADCTNITGCALKIAGKPIAVKSVSAWMDHEITSNKLNDETLGWDWFAFQLENRSELMVYQLRTKAGSKSPFSSGTVVAPDGTTTHLSSEDFIITPSSTWRSRRSGITYPSGWSVSVPRFGYELKVTPTVQDQELITNSSTGVTYWEGRCEVNGAAGSDPAAGEGYVELVGYK